MENWNKDFEDPWEPMTGESRSSCSLLNGHQRPTEAWLNGSQGRLWIPQASLAPPAKGGQGPAQAFRPCPIPQVSLLSPLGSQAPVSSHSSQLTPDQPLPQPPQPWDQLHPGTLVM